MVIFVYLLLNMDSKDEKIRLFFESCLKDWERRHGRKPETMDEMWDAVIDSMERKPKDRPS